VQDSVFQENESYKVKNNFVKTKIDCVNKENEGFKLQNTELLQENVDMKIKNERLNELN